MNKSAGKRAGPSILLTLLAVAIVYTLGLTFVTLELERLIERTITPLIRRSAGVAELNLAIRSGIDGFMRSNNVRLVGFASLALVVVLTVMGLVTQRRGLASLGGLTLFLPTFGYFVIHMSFLAGLQILKVLWLPFWGDWVKLGDIAYLPYMLLVYPLSLLGVDIRRPLAYFLTDAGLLIFALGVLAWLYARLRRKGTADFWLYRLSRHPQYLGWILWSYGLMLLAAQRRDCAPWHTNPGASLPWLLSTLAIVCVALGEEIRMVREHGEEYEAYRADVPFLLPLPRIVSTAFRAPLRLLLGKERPESGRELFLTFVIYATILIVLSLPYVLLGWPPGSGWMGWPFAA
jgi:protein-S-isoprenylcysteine O-methyltransferase Ste14